MGNKKRLATPNFDGISPWIIGNYIQSKIKHQKPSIVDTDYANQKYTNINIKILKLEPSFFYFKLHFNYFCRKLNNYLLKSELRTGAIINIIYKFIERG